MGEKKDFETLYEWIKRLMKSRPLSLIIYLTGFVWVSFEPLLRITSFLTRNDSSEDLCTFLGTWGGFILHAAQFVIVVLLLWFLKQGFRPKRLEPFGKAYSALSIFFNLWVATWAIYAALYFMLSAVDLGKILNVPISSTLTLFSTLSIINALTLTYFLCFVVLMRPDLCLPRSIGEEDPASPIFTIVRRKEPFKERVAMMVFVFVALSLVEFFIWRKTAVPTSSAQAAESVQHAMVFALAMSGVTLALIIASLDRRGIPIPYWIICLLYTYPAINPLYAYYPDIVAWVALFLKFALFVCVAWMLDTGLLLFHINGTLSRAEGAQKDRQRFFQVTRETAYTGVQEMLHFPSESMSGGKRDGST